MSKEKYETYLKIKGLLDNLTEDNFDEFIDICANINFDNYYLNGYIVEKDHIIDNLLYFLTRKELNKVKYLSWMLNKYYPGTTKEIFKTFLNEEKYELCELFKDVKDTKDMPSI